MKLIYKSFVFKKEKKEDFLLKICSGKVRFEKKTFMKKASLTKIG